MRDILDLDRYPLDRPGSLEWTALVEGCRAELAQNGMFNLVGFVTQQGLRRAIDEIKPVADHLSFTHKRRHNIYFRKEVPGLAADDPSLQEFETTNHTVCADQILESVPLWIYEWAPFIYFMSAAMGEENLFPMQDPLARVNVMLYRDGEQLNWHFDRCDFTTTILLQAPESGGDFEFRTDLRTATDPNHAGVARMLRGEDPAVQSLKLEAGTLNVFRGRNTPHRVTKIQGNVERIITVFSYYPKPGVLYPKDEQVAFYGRRT